MKQCADPLHDGVEPLDLTEFYEHPRTLDGRMAACKVCHCRRMKEAVYQRRDAREARGLPRSYPKKRVVAGAKSTDCLDDLQTGPEEVYGFGQTKFSSDGGFGSLIGINIFLHKGKPRRPTTTM